MRRFGLYLLATVFLALGGCSSPAPKALNAELDDLFSRLRTTASAEEAEVIQFTIQHVWAQHKDADIRTLMRHTVGAVHRGDYDAALTMLDEVVRRDPHFLEGWYLRSRVYIALEDYTQAIGDIEKVLSLEPRHYGALMGLGWIFSALGDQKAALRAYEAALAVNPHLQEAREEARLLRDAVLGVAI